MPDDLTTKLRSADEDTVDVALYHACISLPIKSPAELLEAFNCILDVLGVPDEVGDVFEPDEA